jgi:hypothetical protein
MKNVIVALMLLMGMVSFSYAGECVSGNCTLRSRSVNVTKEVISVPVTITRRTVEATRNVGRRTLNRVRSTVR